MPSNLSPSREARVQVQRILSAAYNGTANGHPIAVMNIADGILDTAYAIDVAPLVEALIEGRELAQRNLRKASQQVELWRWGDRVESLLDGAVLARSQEPQT